MGCLFFRIHRSRITIIVFVLLGSIFARQSRAQSIYINNTSLDISQPGLTIDSIDRFLRLNVSPSDTNEGGGLTQINEFVRVWKDRVTHNDTSGSNMFAQYLNSARLASAARLSSGCGSSGVYRGNWTNIGPDVLPDQTLGRAEDIWACPLDTNYLLAATFGGVFRSRNGGATWSCITDNAPISQGITSPTYIAVSPTDTQNIYLGSSCYFGHVTNIQGLGFTNYGNAILSTTNGGTTWKQEVIPFSTPPDWHDTVASISRVYFSPNGYRVYAFRDSGMFYKRLNGTWTSIPVPQVLKLDYWWNLNFVPTSSTTQDSLHFFACTHAPNTGNTNARIVEVVYNPGTNQHTVTIIPLPTTTASTIYLSIPTSNMLYALINTTTDRFLYRYNITTHVWTLITTIGDYSAFEASRINPANIYLGQQALTPSGVAFCSRDTGHTIFQISAYGGNPTHGDIRSLHIYSAGAADSGINDRVYFANDGGIALKRAGVNPIVQGTATLQNINGRGLMCGRFLGVGTSELGGVLLATQMDNGFATYEPRQTTKWWGEVVGDAEEAVICRTAPVAYGGASGGGSTTRINSVDAGGGRTLGHVNGDNINGIANVDPQLVEPHSNLIPMWPDQFGGIYMGRTHMWRFIPGVAGLQRISGNSIPIANTPFDINLQEYEPSPGVFKAIKCMNFTQYLTDLTGYVMYEDGALFYRNIYTTTGTNQTRFNRVIACDFATPGIHPPTDITCDPRHPERVWVSLGGVNYGNTVNSKVMYSPDKGQHWFDISKGLPLKMPVTHVVYQEGANFLYCSTDVGMYKLDMSTFGYTDSTNRLSAYDSVEWTCFNQGAAGQHDFPMVNVTDLEINYCEGKLYASTYGRSVWSSDLMVKDPTIPNPVAGDLIPAQTEVVNTTRTWNTNMVISSGVRITAGHSLTITTASGNPQTVIHMPKNGAIVVDPGASLYVDNARITNDCSGFWKGILVRGTPNQPQSNTSLQGQVFISNGSIIEHARIAVANFGESVGTNDAGGIINAQDSKFYNNRRGIGFAPYHNMSGTVYKGNASLIKNCTFEVNNDYRGDAINYLFEAHIPMSNVDEIMIVGDTFRNTSTLPNTKGVGNAIKCWSSSPFVIPFCTSPGCAPSAYHHNVFQGFNVAINSAEASINPLNYLWVDYADFKDNGIGIYGQYNSWCETFHSSFMLDQTGYPYEASCNCTKGIYLTNTGQFRIEEHNFDSYASHKTNNSLNRYGVQINQSGPISSSIYHNTLHDMNWGIRADNQNADPVKHTGLQASCNTFTGGTLVSIYVAPGGGIRDPQGDLLHPVENVFSSSLTNDVWNVNTNINYYYNVTASLPRGRTGYNTPIHLGIRNACAARFIATPPEFGTNTGYKRSDATTAFNVAKSSWQVEAAYIAGKLDRGNTQQLIDQIHMMPTSAERRDTLLSVAPYISGQTLKDAATNATLIKTDMKLVLQACPDMITSDLLQYLGTDMPSPYSQQDIDTIQTYRSVQTDLTDEIARVNEAYDSMKIAHLDIIRFLKTDTAGLNIDTLAYWQDQVPELRLRYNNVLMYLGVGDYTKSAAAMSAITTEFDLTGDSLDVHNSYNDVVNTLTGAFQDGRTELQLNETELDDLSTVAARGHGDASALAQVLHDQNLGILNLACDTPNVEEGFGEKRLPPGWSTSSSTTASNGSADFLKVYPNPAKDMVTFKYNLPKNAGRYTLTVTTVSDQPVYTVLLTDIVGSIEWDSRKVTQGTYIYRVTAGGKTYKSGKLTVQR